MNTPSSHCFLWVYSQASFPTYMRLRLVRMLRSTGRVPVNWLLYRSLCTVDRHTNWIMNMDGGESWWQPLYQAKRIQLHESHLNAWSYILFPHHQHWDGKEKLSPSRNRILCNMKHTKVTDESVCLNQNSWIETPRTYHFCYLNPWTTVMWMLCERMQLLRCEKLRCVHMREASTKDMDMIFTHFESSIPLRSNTTNNYAKQC